MHIAPNAKCQRVLVLALWLVIDFKQVEADENKQYIKQLYRSPFQRQQGQACRIAFIAHKNSGVFQRQSQVCWSQVS